MMRVLFLAPRLPIPADTGGKIRTLNILKQMTKWAQVHLACFSFDAADKEHVPSLARLGVEVTLVPLGESSFLQKVLGVVIAPLPFSIGKYNSAQMVEALKALRVHQGFDAVHIDHLHMAHYRSLFDGLPTVMDEHNVEYMILNRCAKVEKKLAKKIIYEQQAGKMKAFEKKQASAFSRVLAVSQDDRKILLELNDAQVPVEVIPNGVDTDFFQSEPQRYASEKAIVFTGSLDWLPNEDAVVWFGNEILPLIWQQMPEVKFYVVGKSPSPQILALQHKDARVIVTGRVDDVRPVMDKAQVFVCPIRVGGGTRLKILEAMSMKKAVVSTTIGAEGIAHTNGKNIILADDVSSFAEATLKLLRDPAACVKLGAAGRELVTGQYDWNFVGRTLSVIYHELIAGR